MKSFKEFLEESIDKSQFISSKPGDQYQHHVHNTIIDGNPVSVKFINTHKGTKDYDVHYDVNDESDKKEAGVKDTRSKIKIGLHVARVIKAFHRNFQPSSLTGMAADVDPQVRQHKHEFNTQILKTLNPKKIDVKGNVVRGYF